MTVTIKTADQQEKMRVAGRLAADVLDMIGDYVKPGVTTDELVRICHDFITQEQDAIPAPLNYRGFPKSICTSVNNVVCHGIPGDKTLKSGDAVNIDITVIKDGFHGDTSRMFMVGKENILAKRLSSIAREAMWLGIQELGPGKRLGDIGEAIQKHVEAHRYCPAAASSCTSGTASAGADFVEASAAATEAVGLFPEGLAGGSSAGFVPGGFPGRRSTLLRTITDSSSSLSAATRTRSMIRGRKSGSASATVMAT